MTLLEDLKSYGIDRVEEIVYNPDYDFLFNEEIKPGLQGLEKAFITKTGAVSVDTGVFTGRSPKDKYIVLDETTKDTIWWKSDKAPISDNKAISKEVWTIVKILFLINLQEKTVCNGLLLRRKRKHKIKR